MTYKLTLRGDSTAPISAEYECPVHGRFSITVDRPAPDIVPCPLDSWSVAGSDKEYATCEDAESAALEAGYEPGSARLETQCCADDAHWRYPTPMGRVRAGSMVQGKTGNLPPDHVMMDTRPLADGMPIEEFKARRAKVHRDESLRRVRALRSR